MGHQLIVAGRMLLWLFLGSVAAIGLMLTTASSASAAPEDTAPTDVAAPAAEPISDLVDDVVGPLTEPVTEALAPVTKPVTEPVERAVAPAVRPATEAVSTAVAPVTRPTAEAVAKRAEPVTDAVAPVLEDVAEVAAPVTRSLQPVVNRVTGPVLDLTSQIAGPDTADSPVVPTTLDGALAAAKRPVTADDTSFAGLHLPSEGSTPTTTVSVPAADPMSDPTPSPDLPTSWDPTTATPSSAGSGVQQLPAAHLSGLGETDAAVSTALARPGDTDRASQHHVRPDVSPG